jgi:hypothetical protein
VRNVERDGQQSGKLAIAWSKRVPWAARSPFVCVMYGSEA